MLDTRLEKEELSLVILVEKDALSLVILVEKDALAAVSYTHLTLPTKRIV